MGYVPPPRPQLSYDDFPYLLDWWANAAQPKMVIRSPSLPRTLDEYRRTLYGMTQRDWLPVMGWGFTGGLIALVMAVMAWIAP